MIELNKIYNENCLETMSRMPDNFIDLTVTSPPYDNLRNYNGYDFDFESIAKELFRVTKKGGVVVWVVGDATVNGSESGTSFKQALYFKEIGFNLHDTMIYEKNNYMPLNHNRYEQVFEYMFILSKGNPLKFNALKEKTIGRQFRKPEKVRGAGADPLSKTAKRSKLKPQWTKEDKIIGNIWSYNVGIGQSSNDDEAFNHPAIFPENMAKDHIISWSNESDLVYDCFTGSGTTLKMAHLLKRNWIGSEISKEYCDIAQKRIQPYLDQKVLF
jgi:site-specific DNA-methyltransferase (adenine-specific)